MNRLQRSAGHARTSGKTTVIRVVIGIWLVLGFAVGLAVLFAPEKPDAPPASEIAYEHRPGRAQNRPDAPDAPAWQGDEPDVALAANEKDDKAPVPKYVIYGVVTEQDTGAPVKRARVRVGREWKPEEEAAWRAAEAEVIQARKSEGLDRLREQKDAYTQQGHAETDSQGRYAIRVGLAGTYWVTASEDGFVSASEQASAFEEGETKLRVDLALSRGASISGRVTESGTRAGAEGIFVHVQGKSYGRRPAKTDKNGGYMVTGLLPGEYEVLLDLTHVPYELTGGIPTRNVTIHAPTERVTGIDFVVEAAGVVWGYVLDENRKPIPSVDLVLCSSESIISQALSAVTKKAPPVHDGSEQDGYYELIGVPLNEEWRVYGMSKNWAPQLSSPFLLTDNARNVRVDIFMQSGSDVYGRVVSEAGGAIPLADVFCLPALTKFFKPLDMPPAFREVRSDNDGNFVLRDLPGGDYQILAQKEGFKFAARGVPIRPDGYSDIHNVEVALIPVETGEYAIYGMVTDTGNNPIEGASVILFGGSTTAMTAEGRSTKTDAQGNYVFVGIDSGFYMLTAEAPGYASKTVSNVRLQEPTDIVLEPTAAVRGRVLVRETGAPPESYNVRAIPEIVEGGNLQNLFAQADGIAGAHFNDEEGRFELSLPAGTYTLEARAPGHTAGRTSVTIDAGEVEDAGTIYVTQAGGSIAGRVVTADGKSPAGAVVQIGGQMLSLESLVDLATDMERRGVQVGDDGVFEFTGLPPDTYNIMAQAKGYAQGQSGPVPVGEGQSVTGVQIILGSGGVLQGYVMMNGEIVSGAVVTAVGNGASQMATSDRNGFYRIEGLAEGSYLASAVSIESGISGLAAPLHARVDLYEGQTTTYNFGEAIGASVTGYCSSPPPPGTMGYAIVRVPTADGMAGLNITNPTSWFSGDTTSGNYVMGMAQVDRDGRFQIDNVPEGTFVLDVFYLNLGEMLGGGGRPAFETAITVTGTEPVELNIEIGG